MENKDYGAEARKLWALYQQEKAQSKETAKKFFDMTKEDFDKLHLYQQQELFDEFPDEVRELLKRDY